MVEQRPLRRPAQPRGVRPDRRVARLGGQGRAGGQLPPARLAALAPALLGLPDPDRPLRRLRPGARARRPAAGRAARRRGLRAEGPLAAGRGRGLGGHRLPERAAARPGARPTRWTPSSTPPGTSCATATPATTRRRGTASVLDALDAGRPVHRRGRARDPAPDVRALLHQGARGHRTCSTCRSRSRACSRRGWSPATGRRCPSRRATWSRPREIVERYGADTARCYILFVGHPAEGGDWSRRGHRRASTASCRACGAPGRRGASARSRRTAPTGEPTALLRKAHWAIDKVTRDLGERFATHTSIAAVIELVNEIYKHRDELVAARGRLAAALRRRHRRLADLPVRAPPGQRGLRAAHGPAGVGGAVAGGRPGAAARARPSRWSCSSTAS